MATIVKPPFGRMVNRNLNISQGIVGAYLLNENSGTTVYDSSGLGNNGTMAGTPLPTWTTGSYGSALNFSDRNGSSNINVSGILTSGPFSIVMSWIPPGSANTYGWWGLTGNNSANIYSYSNNTWTWYLVGGSTPNLIPDAINLLVGTCDGSNNLTLRLASGGNIQTGTQTITYGTGIKIGGSGILNVSCQATLNFAYAYNRVLSDDEITKLGYNPFWIYNQTKGRL